MSFEYLPWHAPADRSDRAWLRDASLELTYAEAAARVDALAGQLSDRGVGVGDVVAVMLPNRVEFLLAMLATWRLGGVVTPINPVFTAREASHQTSDSNAALVVVDSDSVPCPELPTLHVDDFDASHAGPVHPHDVSGSDLALLIYTSGSTGEPKGVMLDHANLLAMSTQISDRLAITEADHCLLVLPLFHVNAICVSFLSTALRGGQLTLLRRFDPASFLAAIENHRATYFAAVPTIYARLVEHAGPSSDTSSIRFASCGAAPISRELLQCIGERFDFPVLEGYGLTEATCASACNPLDGVRKLGTVGPAFPGQEIAIAGPGGTLAGVGESGEVLIKGPTVMRGYLNRPEATAKALVDGWLHTGDVGFLDDDGYLTLVDRIKDMIIRGGENIYPKEIEGVLTTHSQVLEAAVVGAAHSTYGEVPVAFVRTYPGASVSAEELLAHAREQLTKIKVPVELLIVEDLPRNPVGKIDKPAIRRSIQAR